MDNQKEIKEASGRRADGGVGCCMVKRGVLMYHAEPDHPKTHASVILFLLLQSMARPYQAKELGVRGGFSDACI